MKLIFTQLALILVMASCVAGGDTNNLKIAIVNNEVKVTDGNCPYKDGCYFKNLSCRYLAHLRDQSIIEEYHEDLESAIRAVKSLDSSAVVYFNENFTDSFVAAIALGEYADEETITSSQIDVWLDTSKAKISDELKDTFKTAFTRFTEDIMAECKMDSERFTIRNSLYYNFIAKSGSTVTSAPVTR